MRDFSPYQTSALSDTAISHAIHNCSLLRCWWVVGIPDVLIIPRLVSKLGLVVTIW